MKRFILAITCLIGGLFLAQAVFALTISPVKMEFAPNPGDLIESQLLLINEKKETRTFYSSFENFRATEETGQPQFIEEKIGLASWLETTPQVTLVPDEQRLIPFNIRVPKDAEPGGHFAAIFWGTSPPEGKQGEGMAVGAKLGMLVLLRVSGEIEEEGKLLEFSAENQKRFFSHLPITFTFRFENSGNVQLRPKGEITIKNIFGGTTAILSANEAGGNVLPQSIRKFEVEWNLKETQITEGGGFFEELKREKDNFAFGRYTAQLNLEYGTAEEEAQASLGFFIIPWRILILAILILAIVALVLTKGIKKYNQWIIAKAKVK